MSVGTGSPIPKPSRRALAPGHGVGADNEVRSLITLTSTVPALFLVLVGCTDRSSPPNSNLSVSGSYGKARSGGSRRAVSLAGAKGTAPR